MECDLPRDQPTRSTGPERFLVRGRLERLPRRRADRELVLRWVASRLIPVHEPVGERPLTARLAELVRDPVGVRRELVDVGLLTRTRDGAEYWRTHVTEFDSLDVDARVDAAPADHAHGEEPQDGTAPGDRGGDEAVAPG